MEEDPSYWARRQAAELAVNHRLSTWHPKLRRLIVDHQIFNEMVDDEIAGYPPKVAWKADRIKKNVKAQTVPNETFR
jgi:hypothetical protein